MKQNDRANGNEPFVWSRKNCAADRSGESGEVKSEPRPPSPPFPIGPDALFIAFYASAELGSFRDWGWPDPVNVLDLFVEFRARTNGLTMPAGSGLVGALVYFGLDTIGAQEKDALRLRIISGGPVAGSEAASRFWTTANPTLTPWSVCCRPCCRA